MTKKQFSLFTLCLIVFLDFLGYALIFPILTPLFFDSQQSFLPTHYDENLRTLLFGLVNMSYPAAQFIGAPVIGKLSDNFGRKKMLVLTLFGSVLGNLTFVIGFSLSNLYILVFGRLFSGFMGGNAAIANSIVGDLSDEKTKARNYGFIGLAMGLGIVLGPFMSGRLINQSFELPFNLVLKTSLMTPFYLSTILAVLALVIVIFVLKEHKIPKNQYKIEFLDSFRILYHSLTNKHLFYIYIITFLLALSFNVFIYHLNIYLFHKFQWDSRQLGDFFAFSGTCLVISLGLINPIITKKIQSKYVLTFSLIGMAITIALSVIPQRSITMYGIMPFLALFYGLSQANIAALLSTTAQRVYEGQGEAFGVNQALQSIVEAITPLLTSFLMILNILAPISFASLSMFISWIVFLYIFWFRKLN
ncbi:MAG: MFS transporter [Candidatus Dojkabacteria bacterium]|nr:MAG: MFS transporter [Candidatus Dojkabacteria bacterium]